MAMAKTVSRVQGEGGAQEISDIQSISWMWDRAGHSESLIVQGVASTQE